MPPIVSELACLAKIDHTFSDNSMITTIPTSSESIGTSHQQNTMIEASLGVDQSKWSENYKNMQLDGIIFIDHAGTIVNFVTIKSQIKEASDPVYRTKVHLDVNGKPILAPPQTFDQMIQAKRRQQMLLYPIGPSSQTISPTDLLSTSHLDQGSSMMHRDTARTVTTSRIYSGRRRPVRRKQSAKSTTSNARNAAANKQQQQPLRQQQQQPSRRSEGRLARSTFD